jgi:tetratricopeptide (TPR) repeat protein
MEIREGLTRDFPEEQSYKHRLRINYSSLGWSHSKRQEYDAALQHYQRALEVSRELVAEAPNSKKYRKYLDDDIGRLAGLCTNRCWWLATSADVSERDPAKAMELANLAIELRPDSANNWNNLGVCQYRVGDWQAAVESLEKADAMIEGGDRGHRMFFAMAHWRLGDREKARELYAQGAIWIAAHRKNYHFRAEAEELMGIGEEDRQRLVAAYLARQVENQPDVVQVWIDRANWHKGQRAYDKAIGDYSQAISLAPDNASLHASRGEACLWLGRYDDAVADWNRAVELGRDDAVSALIRAQLLLIADRTEEYRQACKEILGRFDQSDCHAARACVLAPEAVPDPMVPVKLAQGAVSRDPREWTLYTLGMARLRAGQFDEAEQRFQESLKAAPSWQARFLNSFGLALVYHERGETKKARESLDEGVELMEQDPGPTLQDRIEGQLLRREVEKLLGKPAEEKDDAEGRSDERHNHEEVESKQKPAGEVSTTKHHSPAGA